MPRKTKKRGRKSAASKQTATITAIDGGAPPRPAAPGGLNKAEMDIWNKVTRSEPPDFFCTDALLSLLADYCRHRAASDVLSDEISKFKPDWLKKPDGALHYDRLLRMRDRETKAVMRCATKLRITNQARYTPQRAATASANKQTGPRPWEM